MSALVEIASSDPPGPSGVSVTEYNDSASSEAIVLTANTNILIPNNGRTTIRVRRTSSAASKLTIVTEQTVEGLAVADRDIVLPTTSGAVWEGGQYDPRLYNDADGKMSIGFSVVDGVELSVGQR